MRQGFGAILKPLAFRGLLCSGPPRGRHVTFVAPRAWLGDWLPVPTEEASTSWCCATWTRTGRRTRPSSPAGSTSSRPWPRSPSRGCRPAAGRGGRGLSLPVDAPDGGGEDTVLLLPAFDPYVVGSLRRLDRVSSGPQSPRFPGRRAGSPPPWW
ncbi:hypothetical protein GCM10020358_24240 [Amorphoplanes nipponensis]|uniref:hypothetical protein n=1 Tax=Actinoplanes nipponensis TaxID=135950 RepID=UPI0031EF45E6